MPTFEHQNEYLQEGNDLVGVHVSGEQEVPPQRRGRGSMRWIAAITALAFAATGAGVSTAAIHHPYQIDIDGTVLASYSWNGTVASALADNDVILAEHDKVEPGPDTPLTDGMVIRVEKAKLHKIVVDGQTIEVWSTADSADALLQEQEILGRKAILTASRGAMKAGFPIVDADTQIPFIIGNQERLVSLPAGATLVQALHLAGVELAQTDIIELALRGTGIQLAINTSETMGQTSVAEVIPASSTVEPEAALTVREAAASAGSKTPAAKAPAARADSRKQQTTTSASKSRPAAKPKSKPGAPVASKPPAPVTKPKSSSGKPKSTKPSTGQTSNPKTSTGQSTTPKSSGGQTSNPKPNSGQASTPTNNPPASTTPTNSVWNALAQCESGGNPRAVSRTGRYHGLYQFSVSTWQAVGGSGLPSEATPAEQLKRAKILQARYGWGQWPACSRKLGLR